MPTDSSADHTFLLDADYAGQRIDQVLAQLLPEFSRARLQSWLKQGQILVDGQTLRPKDKVSGGEQVHVHVSISDPLLDQPEAIDLDIIHEDDVILVINKPAGLVVHPGAGNATGTVLNALLHHCPNLADVPRAGIVHRLDKDTTGLMVVAKTLPAHTHLVNQLQARSMSRQYEALVCGRMTAGCTIEQNIGRHPKLRKQMAVVPEGYGKPAMTDVRVAQSFVAHTHVQLKLHTGRTHQIRVHLAHLGYPLVGDPVYGRRLLLPPGSTETLTDALRQFKRQALHAHTLGLEHPTSWQMLQWSAPAPADFQMLLHLIDVHSQTNTLQ